MITLFEDLITDRTLEDVQNRTSKGHYNASDLNRVEHAAKQISEMLTKEAYPVVYQPHKRLVSTEEWDENTVLLLHGDELMDSSINAIPLTNNGVTVSTEQSKFGDKSIKFTNNSSIAFSSEYVDFRNNNFTVEWWERPNSSTSGARFCTQLGVAETGISMGNNGTGLFINENYNTSGWDILSSAPGFSVTTGKWTHWAVVRNGTVISTYKNGVKYYSSNIGNVDLIINTLVNAGIGNNAGNNNPFLGYMNEFRISNIARYTTNFNVPTEPFAAKTGSVEYTEADWLEPENYNGIPDHPTEAEMERYLHNVEEIKRQFYQKKSTPTLPKQMSRLKHSGANAIEQLIVDTNDLLIETEKAKRKSGTFKAGELLP